MTSVPILIGGAAGSVATKLLLQMGFPARAIVRGDDERAQSLRALGAFVADLLDLRAVRRAFQRRGRAVQTPMATQVQVDWRLDL
jgi:hypothetical protein